MRIRFLRDVKEDGAIVYRKGYCVDVNPAYGRGLLYVGDAEQVAPGTPSDAAPKPILNIREEKEEEAPKPLRFRKKKKAVEDGGA